MLLICQYGMKRVTERQLVPRCRFFKQKSEKELKNTEIW